MKSSSIKIDNLNKLLNKRRIGVMPTRREVVEQKKIVRQAKHKKKVDPNE